VIIASSQQVPGDIFDGVIEPLVIRKIKPFLSNSIDVPFDPRSIRGNLESGNHNLFLHSDRVITECKFTSVNTGSNPFRENSSASFNLLVNQARINNFRKIDPFVDNNVRSLFNLTMSFASLTSQELLINPGNDLSLINPIALSAGGFSGIIRGWTQVSSAWGIQGDPPSFPLPQSGSQYFYAGQSGSAELRQDVDVSRIPFVTAGSQSFTFTGYIQTYDQTPSDTSEVIVEYRNPSGVILSSYDSGALINTGSWKLIGNTRLAPSGTTTIRVRLLAERHNGTANDGYFDSLSLKALPSGIYEIDYGADNYVPTGYVSFAKGFTWANTSGSGADSIAFGNMTYKRTT